MSARDAEVVKYAMAETNLREVLRGEEVAIFDFLGKTMTSNQWAEWLKAPLELAAAQGDASLSQKLVGAGAEVGNALHGAVRGGHEEVVNNLLEKAAAAVSAKDHQGYTPLHVALHRTADERCGEAVIETDSSCTWRDTVVPLLLRKGADPNAVSRLGTPLHDAVGYNLLGAAKALLEAGADFNIRVEIGDGDSRSALDLAAGISSADMVELLIEHGADIHAAGLDGFTPLHHAAYSQFAEVADVLISAGANIEIRNADDDTPLRVSAGLMNLTMARAFLNHGAKVNDRCRYAQTPLHVTVRSASAADSRPRQWRKAADMVDFLLRSGGDETLVDDDGRTAWDLTNMNLEEGVEHEDDLEEDASYEDVIKRVRELLANAPADKAWRRRGFWALCRAHPDRLQEDLLRPDNARIDGTKRRSTRSSLRPFRVRDEIDLQCNGGSWADAAVWLLGLGEEAIFRTIVGYL